MHAGTRNAGLEQFTVPTEQVAHLGKQSFVMVIKTGPSFVIVSIYLLIFCIALQDYENIAKDSTEPESSIY